MIKIYLSGGLGNNLFQIYLALLQEKKGKEIIFADNLLTRNIATKFLNWSIHENQLNELNIETKKINFVEFYFDMAILFLSKIFSAKIFGYFYDSNHLNDMNYENILNYFDEIKVISGYFQYPSLIKEEDLKLLKTKLSISNKIHKNNNKVIHLRGGDLLNQNSKLNQYYLNCIEQLGFDQEYTLITNDINFRESFLNKNNKYTFKNKTNVRPIDDFIYMMSCNNLVCSYSTFSLWAGLLGDHQSVFIPIFEDDNFFSKKAMISLPKRFILTP